MKNITRVDNYFTNAKNQFLLVSDKAVTFQSYSTIVAIYDKSKDSLTVNKYWTYSKTTQRYFYQFLDYVFYFSNSQYKELAQSLRQATNKKKIIEKWIKNNTIKYVNKWL